ncbi:CynX/NimT family MFS transporter [Streptomyces sp. NPDC008141]|uniref:CynX/NimT family MFS transporter n=1 Tax=Streptomyces sp. NPDC008141 TaxID=3364815 RepID=UPI0036ECFF18
MSAHQRRIRAGRLWILAGIVLLSINLRPAITGTAPVLGELSARYGLDDTGAAVLTTLPVLCLGVFASLAPPLARRVGTEPAIVAALGLITAGIGLRGLASPLALYTGTVLAGTGIAIGNVLLPAIIKHRFPIRTGTLTGIAMTIMAASGAVAAGLAIPLDETIGWHLAFIAWALPSLAAALLWVRNARTVRYRRIAPVSRGRHARRPDSVPADAEPTGRLLRSGLAWSVAGFLGAVSCTFYVLVSWLPMILQDYGYTGSESAAMLSVMMLVGIPFGFVIPLAATRLTDQRPLLLAVLAVMAAGLGGLVLAPAHAWTWVLVTGVATGSAFPLAIILLALRSPSPPTTARLSGMAQTVGYLLAALGPLTMGLLRSATGSWQTPLLVLLVLLVPKTVLGLYAARPGLVHSRLIATGTGPDADSTLTLSSR